MFLLQTTTQKRILAQEYSYLKDTARYRTGGRFLTFSKQNNDCLYTRPDGRLQQTEFGVTA